MDKHAKIQQNALPQNPKIYRHHKITMSNNYHRKWIHFLCVGINDISLSTQKCCILCNNIYLFFFRKRWYHRYSSASQRRTAMDLTCKIQARIGTRRADGSCFNSKKPYLPFRSLIIYNNYLPKCWVDLSSNLRGIIDIFCSGQSQDQYNSMYGAGNKYTGCLIVIWGFFKWRWGVEIMRI